MDIKALKHQIPILPVAQELTKLKQLGATWRGGCPCCGADPKKLPFLVDPVGKKGDPHYHCFSCGEKGDVFNLWALKTTGHTKPSGAAWREVVKDCANAHHIEIVEDAPRDPRQVRAERLRNRVQEAWAVTVDHAAAGLRSEAAEATRADLLGLGWTLEQAQLARVGYLPRGGAGLIDALNALGFDAETRRDAGLSDAAVRDLMPGRVLLRRSPAGAAGLSQPLPNGTWIHCIPDGDVLRGGDRLAPAFLGDAPRGKAGEVLIVLVPDLDAGLALAKALRDVAADQTSPARKAARAVGVAIAGLDDPTDPNAYSSVTARAVVLVPTPEQTPREVYAHAAQIFQRGPMVRIAPFPPLAPGGGIDGTEALRRILTAPDFFAWQWAEIARATDARPGSDRAREWVERRAMPLVGRVDDALARDVLTHRARRLAGLEAATRTPSP